MSDNMAEEQMAELEGPGGDGLFGAYLLDWIALCDDLQDGDARGYWTLRALVYEHRGVVNRVRVMTMADMCQLIPGPKGKPSSLTRVRGMLDRLSKVGLMSTPEGAPLKTSSRGGALGKPLRIKIHDRPCNGYTPRWRNVDEKLKAVQPQAEQAARQAAEQAAAKSREEREERAKRAGRNSDPQLSEASAGRNSDPAGRNSDPASRNSDPHSAADQAKHDPFFFPQSSASLSSATDGPADTRPATATQASTEREIEAAPTTAVTVDLPVQREAQEQPASEAQQVLAAYEEALGGPALPSVRSKVLDQAAELLAVRPLWWLIDRARELPQWGRDLEKHCANSRAPFTRASSTRRPDPGKCPRHPALPLDCPTCVIESEQHREREAKSAPASMADILAAAGVPWKPKVDA